MSIVRDVAQTFRPPGGDRHGPLVPLLVTLTILTGVVDAVSYLELGHVFVANMTGNIIFLGFALAGAGGLSPVASLIALAAFLFGALAGGWLGARYHAHRGHLLRAANATQVLLIGAAVLLAILAVEPPARATRYALIVLLALALGVQNAAAQRLSVPDLTTTVLTRTLTGLASESGIVGGAGAKLGRRIIRDRRDAARRADRRSTRTARIDRRGTRCSTRDRRLQRLGRPSPLSYWWRVDTGLARALVFAAVTQPCRDAIGCGDQMRPQLLEEHLGGEHGGVCGHARGRDNLA